MVITISNGSHLEIELGAQPSSLYWNLTDLGLHRLIRTVTTLLLWVYIYSYHTTPRRHIFLMVIFLLCLLASFLLSFHSDPWVIGKEDLVYIFNLGLSILQPHILFTLNSWYLCVNLNLLQIEASLMRNEIRIKIWVNNNSLIISLIQYQFRSLK